MSSQKLAKRPRKASSHHGSNKNHKFESFSQRVARFKVDPIRRGDRHREVADEEGSSSYFRTSLEEWRELNLSGNFTEFAEKVEPFSNSLVQILHHQDAIHSLLLEHICKQDSLSLEPLLSLLAHFAHDLGVRFEKFFQDAVSAICSIAAKHETIEVIEWSFNCLAWLFKYLSKLLAPDLRPLITLMAPLLGLERQKAFVTRFAAEALSYLTRKVASAKDNGRGLRNIINHIFEILNDCPSRQVQQLQDGLANLLADTIKGIQKGLHSGGPIVLKALVDATLDQPITESDKYMRIRQVTEMVIVNTIHNTDSDGFESGFSVLLNVVAETVQQPMHHKMFQDRLLFLIASTRKGTRISDWEKFIEVLDRSISQTSEVVPNHEDNQLPLSVASAACVLQYSPLDLVGHQTRKLVSKFKEPKYEQYFLPLCVLTAEFGQERFDNLLKSDFQGFVTSRCNVQDPVLYAFLQTTKLQLRGLSAPEFQESMGMHFDNLGARSSVNSTHSGASTDLHFANACLDLLDAFGESFTKSLPLSVTNFVKGEISRLRHDAQTDPSSLFALCKGLHSVAMNLDEAKLVEVLPLRDVLGISKIFRRSPGYLKAILAICRGLSQKQLTDLIDVGSGGEERDCGPFITDLIENVSSSSKTLRELSLEVLSEICRKTDQSDNKANILETALIIERLPLSPESARALSAQIKALADRYASEAESTIVRLAIPSYLFGILHFKLASACTDACSALETISHVKGTDEIIVSKAFSWLSSHEIDQPDSETDDSLSRNRDHILATQWQCTNGMQLEAILSDVKTVFEEPLSVLQKQFESDIALEPDHNQRNRSQALKLLNSVPRVAEKRSRLIVPLFLAVFQAPDAEEKADLFSAEERTDGVADTSTLKSVRGWPKKDQIAFMTLLGKFVNPGVLFKSQDVHNVLMDQLCIGDSDTQRSALKAVFAWKHPFVKPYEDNLLNILDVNMFREELAVFLGSDETESTIQQDHRAMLMPIIVRLLYGRAITRSKTLSHGRGQAGMRKSVLNAIARFQDADIKEFLKIMLGSLNDLNLAVSDISAKSITKTNLLSQRKQLGLLRMLEDVLVTLANRLGPFVQSIADAIMFCAVQSTQKMKTKAKTNELDDQDKVEWNAWKTCRQTAIACLDKLFQVAPNFNWQPYVPLLFDELINPRVPSLPEENSQGVSSLLRLFSTWASEPRLQALLFEHNDSLIKRVSDCLLVPSAKPEVLNFVATKILGSLVIAAEKNPDVSESGQKTLQQRFREGLGMIIISRLQGLLSRPLEKSLVESAVQIVIPLHPYISGSKETSDMIRTSLELLDRPPKEMSPKTKSQVLEMLGHFVSKIDFAGNEQLRDQIYTTLSSLFSYFQDSVSRQRLCSTFCSLCMPDPNLLEVAEICQALNAFASSRLNEPDFEKRLQGFRIVNEERYLVFSPLQWLPVVHNALFLIKDDQELAMRTSASLCLQRLILASEETGFSSGHLQLLTGTLIPALEKGMRESSELVRAEFVSVLAEGVRRHCPGLEDMKVLLGTDDESAFFNNILHIQQHRRTRALRRLAEHFRGIASANIHRFCIPLVEQYVALDEETDNNLAMEAVNSLERVSSGLDWQRFRALLHKFAVRLNPQSPKLSIRSLAALVSSLYQATLQRAAMNETMDGGEAQSPTALEQSLPARESLAPTLTKSVLPKLMEIIHYADEATVDTRVLIAPSAVKIMLTFTDEEISLRLPALLIDVCNILKARAQDARDSARKVLVEMSSLIGPQYFGFVLKQLKSSLQRGYQLHVLAYTVHDILVPLSSKFKFGELDYCLDLFMDVIIDEIFGIVGQEKDSEDFISRMKEVKKKNLSYDSLEILASMCSITSISQLIMPLKAQLQKPRPRIEKVDESLRRIREGLRRNQEASTPRALMLCYELMQGSNGSNSTSSTESSTKLAAFATDLLRRILDKHEQLKTPKHMAGFVPILITFIKNDRDDVRSSAMRCISSIIKLDLESLDVATPDLLRAAKRTVEAASSTNTPLAQTAIRLASAILRDRTGAVMKQSFFEAHIAYLLTRIKPDLREPAQQSDRDRQIAAFNLIKAVMSRGILLKEIYEVMDVVREIMVSSRESSIPQLSRGAYSRFLLEYFPEEGKGFSKQLDFLINNLQYSRTEGRQSVMEVILFIISKRSDETVQPLLVTFFLPLLLVLGADEVSTCRDYARVLIGKIFERADKERTSRFKAQLLKWLEPGSQPIWQRISLQCWDILWETNTDAQRELGVVFDAVARTIEQAKTTKFHKDKERLALVDATLTLLKRICNVSPATAFSSEKEDVWANITSLIDSTPTQLKLPLVELDSRYLNHFKASSGNDVANLSLPVKGSYGLELDAAKAWTIAESHLQAIKEAASPKASNPERLAKASIQNLTFIARISSVEVAEDLLSYAAEEVKREDPSSPVLARLYALDLLASLIEFLPASTIAPSSEDVLAPLQNLTDTSIPQARPFAPFERETYESLTVRAHELLSKLQTKLGTSTFVDHMSKVQKDVRERREERKRKRDVDRIARPETAERKRARKHENSKVKRRERNAAAAGMRRGW